MERVEQIFKHPTHLKILLLFHKNKELVTNLIKIGKTINASRVTVRRAINDLVDAKVLEDLHAWRSRIIRVANTTQAQLVFEFIEKINGGFVLKKKEAESFTDFELASAEIKRLNRLIDVLREDYNSLFNTDDLERKMEKRPIKIKEALQRCHLSPHYKLFYEALQANIGKVEGMYQEYCTLCKSKNIKPLKEVSMGAYISALVKEGKIIPMRGRYIIKGQIRAVEVRSRG